MIKGTVIHGSIMISHMPDEHKGKDGYYVQGAKGGKFLGSVFRNVKQEYVFYTDNPAALTADLLRDICSFVEDLDTNELDQLIRN